jgi:outer membrane lipoprotein SlyB
MKTTKFVSLLVFIVLVTGGCASSMSPNVYSRDQAQKVQTVHKGEVIMVREVQIEGTKSGVGAIAGGIMGFALGSTMLFPSCKVPTKCLMREIWFGFCDVLMEPHG